jgi:mobilization protein NikA
MKWERKTKAQIKKMRERPIRFAMTLNQEEYDLIVRESRKAGVCYGAYVRAMTFEGKLIARLTDEERSLFREMVAISVGLSQIIAIAREKEMTDLLPFFERYRQTVDVLLNKIRLW